MGHDPLAATARHWDLSGPLPEPIGDWMRCPVCRAANAIPKNFLFHPQPEGTIPWRVDAGYKCGECACVFDFGVILTEEQWDHFVPFGDDGRRVPRSEIRESLHEQPVGS